jgi:hypothetical protein
MDEVFKALTPVHAGMSLKYARRSTRSIAHSTVIPGWPSATRPRVRGTIRMCLFLW